MPLWTIRLPDLIRAHFHNCTGNFDSGHVSHLGPGLQRTVLGPRRQSLPHRRLPEQRHWRIPRPSDRVEKGQILRRQLWEYTHDANLSEDEWSNILYLSIEYILQNLNNPEYQHIPANFASAGEANLPLRSLRLVYPRSDKTRKHLTLRTLLPSTAPDFRPGPPAAQALFQRNANCKRRTLHKWTIQ